MLLANGCATQVFTSQLKTSKALDPTLISLNPTEADGYASAAARLIESNVHVSTTCSLSRVNRTVIDAHLGIHLE